MNPKLACLMSAVFVAACGGGGGATESAPATPTTTAASTDSAVSTASTESPAASVALDAEVSPAPASTSASTAASTPALSSAPAVGAGSGAVFFSGHSLMDNPMPDDAAAIAASMGRSTLWNQQNVLGSPIRVRTRGMSYDDASFSGYRSGKNREGSNMDVVGELRSPKTVSGQRYDAMVLTERHDIASAIQYEDTVRYARHFHERLVEGNASASTYLYHSWLDTDKSNPAAWIAYERAAAPVWQCVASRINTSLANEGRGDRMHYLPAGLALTNLVERATQGYVDGVTAGSVSETMNRIFSDNVHLTRLGTYYMSLVTYASLYKASPQGAWAPGELSASTVRSLQDLAWSTVASYYANPASPSSDSCKALMRDSFCSTYYSFTRNPGAMGACVSLFSQGTSTNPFHFDAANDRAYWFAAPQ